MGYAVVWPEDPSDDQVLLADSARRFLDATCPSSEVRRLAEAEEAGWSADWWRRAAGLGWTGLLVPSDDAAVARGGLVDLAVVVHQLGRAIGPGPLVPSALAVGLLVRGGSDPAVERWVPALVDGSAVGSWALAEPGSWDRASVAVRAEAVGGGWRLFGTKHPVEAVCQANVLVVTARCEDGAVVDLVVPADSPRLERTPVPSLDLVRRYGTVTFDGTPVDAEAVLGRRARAGARGGVGARGGAEAQQPGPTARGGSAASSDAADREGPAAWDDIADRVGPAGWDDMADLFVAAWVVLQCAEMVGATGAMLERTVDYAFERVSFGRPLATYQALKHRFADLVVAVEGAAALTTAAAWAVDAALTGEGSPRQAVELAHAAKVHAGEQLPLVLQDCVQLHGGIGVTWDHDLHLALRRVVQDRALVGTPAQHAEAIAVGLGLGEAPAGVVAGAR
jgi:alkylation response protein AidB-like acyl-CoA dehydrogenase